MRCSSALRPLPFRLGTLRCPPQPRCHADVPPRTPAQPLSLSLSLSLSRDEAPRTGPAGEPRPAAGLCLSLCWPFATLSCSTCPEAAHSAAPPPPGGLPRTRMRCQWTPTALTRPRSSQVLGWVTRLQCPSYLPRAVASWRSSAGVGTRAALCCPRSPSSALSWTCGFGRHAAEGEPTTAGQGRRVFNTTPQYNRPALSATHLSHLLLHDLAHGACACVTSPESSSQRFWDGRGAPL